MQLSKPSDKVSDWLKFNLTSYITVILINASQIYQSTSRGDGEQCLKFETFISQTHVALHHRLTVKEGPLAVAHEMIEMVRMEVVVVLHTQMVMAVVIEGDTVHLIDHLLPARGGCRMHHTSEARLNPMAMVRVELLRTPMVSMYPPPLPLNNV